ncbi:hypothetical protein OOK31_31815 [Streptomyces sp. NBC_00249]|uniref:hypothetical protein n=1 Tax=Streptomyces sp. NBC_00249 TaxID=2975690 RepID=UPI002256FCDD|nr:hypothetical protein [Streptomyces sp. NBC_00249]MCX5198418.1 hypothetical protein [Streptomyces sp. NBC_00249]
MDTSWWPAALAAVAVAVVVLIPRLSRQAVRTVAPPHAPGPAPRVRAGELWCLADGRPCLVLAVRVHREEARVAWITGKYDDRRPGVIPLPPGAVAVGAHGRGAFLEADRPQEVSLWEFRRRVGLLDPTVWDEVEGLAGGGGAG